MFVPYIFGIGVKGADKNACQISERILEILRSTYISITPHFRVSAYGGILFSAGALVLRSQSSLSCPYEPLPDASPPFILSAVK